MFDNDHVTLAIYKDDIWMGGHGSQICSLFFFSVGEAYSGAMALRMVSMVPSTAQL